MLGILQDTMLGVPIGVEVLRWAGRAGGTAAGEAEDTAG